VRGVAERSLDGPQLLVAQHRLQGVEAGTGVQYEDPVEAGIRLVLCVIDGKTAGVFGLEKAATAGFTDQRFVAPLELGEPLEVEPATVPAGHAARCLPSGMTSSPSPKDIATHARPNIKCGVEAGTPSDNSSKLCASRCARSIA
jgi:hypothetical protein